MHRRTHSVAWALGEAGVLCEPQLRKIMDETQLAVEVTRGKLEVDVSIPPSLLIDNSAVLHSCILILLMRTLGTCGLCIAF